jgi:hypothetical protein
MDQSCGKQPTQYEEGAQHDKKSNMSSPFFLVQTSNSQLKEVRTLDAELNIQRNN